MIRWPLRIALAVLLLMLAGVWWLLGSAGGSRWLVQDILPGQVPGLAIERVQGRLWQGLQLQGVRFQSPGVDVQLDHVAWRWDLSRLVDRQLTFTTLEAGILLIQTGGASEADNSPVSLPALPVTIGLPRITIDTLEFTQGSTHTRLSGIHADLGIGRRLEIHRLRLALQEPLVDLDLQGTVALDDPAFPLTATLDWQGQLPQVGGAAGHARVEGDLHVLRLDHQLTKPYTATTRGEIQGLDGGGPRLAIEGDWQALGWPLSGARQVASEKGAYHLAGPLDALSLDVQADLAVAGYPRGKLVLRATLQPERVLIDSLSLATPSGRLSGKGSILYAPAIAWDLTLTGKELDPALLGEPWSGRLQLAVDTHGRMTPAGPEGQLQLRKMDGTLRGYPFAAHGELALTAGEIGVHGMALSSGSGQITLNGRIRSLTDIAAGPKMDMSLTAAVPDLGQLWPGLRGELAGQGRIGGSLRRPSLSGQFHGAALGYADLGAEQADIRLDWPSAQGGEGLARFELKGLRAGEHRWGEADLALRGATDRHRLTASLRDGLPRLDLALAGGWNGQAWKGKIQQLEVDPLGKGNWSNAQAVDLALERSQVRLSLLCLVQQAQRICLEGNWHQRKGIDAKAVVHAFDFSSLDGLLPPGLGIVGEVNGEAKIQGPPDHLTAKASLVPGDGRLLLRDSEAQGPIEVHYSNAHVDLDYQQGKLRADAGLSLERRGRLTTQIAVIPESRGTARLRGSLEGDLPSLEVLAPLVPQARIQGGSAHLKATLAGSIAQPRVTGGLSLVDTVLEYPDLGLRLENVKFDLSSQGGNRLAITGSAKSGEGTLGLDGWLGLDSASAWPYSLRIRGKRVLAVRLPDTRVMVSPDLRLAGNTGELKLEGVLSIPEAEIEVRELPAGAVQPSEDEVILDNKGQQAETAPAGPKIRGQVALELGDKVRFAGFGLKTRLEGHLDLRFEPGQNRANGAVDLKDGRYKAWGQDLSIEKGRLLFAGPVDNPGVDLRALRVSSDGKVKAYLDVGGTLRKPETRVRTEPPTSSTDALAYLLTGAAMGESKGIDQAQLLQAAGSLGLEKTLPALQAIREDAGLDELGLNNEGDLKGSALVAGKYLSPELYVRYMQGLFDSSAILSLRYRLSKHLSVETRSGTTQSVEVTYSHEHD